MSSGKGKTRDEHTAYHREWLKRNPNYVRESRQRNYIPYLLSRAKQRAGKDQRAFNISAEDLQPYPTHCPVLGVELQYGTATKEDKDCAASLDRVNNTLGYVKGNVRIICRRANTIKTDASLEELQAIVGYMMAHNGQVEN